MRKAQRRMAVRRNYKPAPTNQRCRGWSRERQQRLKQADNCGRNCYLSCILSSDSFFRPASTLLICKNPYLQNRCCSDVQIFGANNSSPSVNSLHHRHLEVLTSTLPTHHTTTIHHGCNQEHHRPARSPNRVHIFPHPRLHRSPRRRIHHTRAHLQLHPGPLQSLCTTRQACTLPPILN